MNKKIDQKQVKKIAKVILAQLQKRDGINIEDNFDLSITVNGRIYDFNIAQLYTCIAIELKSFYDIPQNYLKYYIKVKQKPYNYQPTPIQKKIIKIIFKKYHVNQVLLAGGSMAKTVLLTKANHKKVVIKKAHNWAYQKLLNELNFINKLSENSIIARHLPKILFYKHGDKSVSITLKYYPAKTLAYKILFGKISREKAWKQSIKILTFIKNYFWTTAISPAPQNYIRDFFLKRIKENTKLLIKEAPNLSSLIRAKTVIINNQKYYGLLRIIKEIEKNKKLIKLLKPPMISNIWGDLHPNNILLLKNNFILIDARGDRGDPMYDLGKMYHTFGPGRYDFIDNDLYSIKIEFRGRNVPVITRKFFKKHQAWGAYGFLEKKLLKNIKRFISKDDYFWKLRWDFINFCIFSTMPPFLVKHKKDELRVMMGYSNALILGMKLLKTVKKYV